MWIDKEYIKSSNYRYRNIINELTNSEVSEKKVRKYNELKMEKERLQQEIDYLLAGHSIGYIDMTNNEQLSWTYSLFLHESVSC